jgi:hypothetical protein
MPVRFRSVLFAFVSCALVSIWLGACAGQGEGDVCDINAGNTGDNDCRSGLVCNGSLPGVMGARCCPSDPALATSAVCRGNQSDLTTTPTTPVNVPDAAGDGASDGATGPQDASASETDAAGFDALAETSDAPMDALVPDAAVDGAPTPALDASPTIDGAPTTGDGAPTVDGALSTALDAGLD